MESTTNLEDNFCKYFSELKSFCLESDVQVFSSKLNDIFVDGDIMKIRNNDGEKKIQAFWRAFRNSTDKNKYERLCQCAKDGNQWIYQFLTCDSDSGKNLQIRYKVLQRTLNMHLRIHFKKSVIHPFSMKSIHQMCYNGLIDNLTKEKLDLLIDQPNELMLKLFDVVSLHNPDCYGKFLWIIFEVRSCFAENLFEEIKDDLEGCILYEQLTEAHVNRFAKAVIEKQIEELRSSNETQIETDGVTDDYSDNDSNMSDSDADSLNLGDLGPSKVSEVVEKLTLELKDFQKELAAPALEGKNIIVYAPTGAGKTNIASYIANNHLEKYPQGRVAFLVHRTPLVEQQRAVLDRYCREDIRTIAMHGKSDSSLGPLITHLDNSQIFVMTSDILDNALTFEDENKISSICQFTMIIFDECHNCMKNHSYVRIMRHYFKEKLKILKQQQKPRESTSTTWKLPQIIGLSASPRTQKKNDVLGIKQSLMDLCANLDCYIIATVKDNIDEMNQFLSTAEQETFKTLSRLNDRFENDVIALMVACEKELNNLKDKGELVNIPFQPVPTGKFSEKYFAFIGNLQKIKRKCKGRDCAIQVQALYHYLNAYYRGLIINQMFNQTFALETIEKFLSHDGVNFTCEYDKLFYNQYLKFRNSIVSDQSPNPSINFMIEIITEQLHSDPNSKILIFVREINYARYLAKLLKEYNFEASYLVGSSNSKSLSQRSTRAEIAATLNDFRNSSLQIIVATTVLEEGLDVALCNLVISYGHVTNETAMIQRKGRARAANSRYILLLPPMLHWMERKEMLNEIRRKKMMNLINNISSIASDKEMRSYIDGYQKNNFYASMVAPIKPAQYAKDWKFLCQMCLYEICSVRDLRVIENAHRVIMDPTMLKNFIVKQKERTSYGHQSRYESAGAIFCPNCKKHEVGRHIYYDKVRFFQLNITQCDVRKCLTDSANSANSQNIEKLKNMKRWKQFDCHYTIPPLDKSTDFPDYVEKLDSSEGLS